MLERKFLTGGLAGMRTSHPNKPRKREMIKQHMAHRIEVVIVAVLLVIALAHLLRLVTGVEVIIAGTMIPVWTSLFGCVGPAVLAGLFWWSRH